MFRNHKAGMTQMLGLLFVEMAISTNHRPSKGDRRFVNIDPDCNSQRGVLAMTA